MTPIFRWTGQYVGFLAGGWLFDAGGRYCGWCEDDGRVWRADGTSLGQIVEANYVLCCLRATPPVRRTPRVPPVPVEPLRRPGDRLPRLPRPGWVDALDEIGRMPSRDELIGEWTLDDGVLRLDEDSCFEWAPAWRPEQAGSWAWRGNLVITADPGAGAGAGAGDARIVYRVVEFTGETLTLRRLTTEETTLPFTMRRRRP